MRRKLYIIIQKIYLHFKKCLFQDSNHVILIWYTRRILLVYTAYSKSIRRVYQINDYQL